MKMRKSTLIRLLLLYVPPMMALAAMSLLSAGQLSAAASAADRQGGGNGGRAGQSQSQAPGATRPDGRPGNGNADRRGGDGFSGRRRGGGPPWLRVREPADEEWKRAEAFMALHSPERWKWYQGIQDEGRQKGMKRFLWWQFQQADELRNRDPELYQLKVERVERDDEVFAAALAVKDESLTDEQRAGRKEHLRALVSNLVHLDVKERRARIERLQRDLVREEKALADLDNPEGFDRRVAREVNNILGLADNVRHGGGGGGGNNRRDRRGPSGESRGDNGNAPARQRQ